MKLCLDELFQMRNGFSCSGYGHQSVRERNSSKHVVTSIKVLKLVLVKLWSLQKSVTFVLIQICTSKTNRSTTSQIGLSCLESLATSINKETSDWAVTYLWTGHHLSNYVPFNRPPLKQSLYLGTDQHSSSHLPWNTPRLYQSLHTAQNLSNRQPSTAAEASFSFYRPIRPTQPVSHGLLSQNRVTWAGPSHLATSSSGCKYAACSAWRAALSAQWQAAFRRCRASATGNEPSSSSTLRSTGTQEL